MTATITVTAEPTNSPPRWRIDIAGMTGTIVNVARVVDADDGALSYPVRTGNPATLVAGAVTLYDYEAPFNEPTFYSAVSDGGSTATAGRDGLRYYGVQQPWLIHPGVPSRSVQLDGPTIGDETSDVNQGVHVILGREDPIVVGDGVRHSPQFQLTTKTRSTAADDALRALLADGSTLLLQYVFPFTDLYDFYWVSIGATTRARMTGNYGEPYWLWTLPCTVTSTPTGLQQAQRTWADLLSDFATWADADAAYATWNDLLTNTRV